MKADGFAPGRPQHTYASTAAPSTIAPNGRTPDLPADILRDIFAKFCSRQDRAHVRLTCRAFHDLVAGSFLPPSATSKLTKMAAAIPAAYHPHHWQRDGDMREEQTRRLESLWGQFRLATSATRALAKRPICAKQPPVHFALKTCAFSEIWSAEREVLFVRSQKDAYCEVLAHLPRVDILWFAHPDAMSLSAEDFAFFLSQPAFCALKIFRSNPWKPYQAVFGDKEVFGMARSSITTLETIGGVFRLTPLGVEALDNFLRRQTKLKFIYMTLEADFQCPRVKAHVPIRIDELTRHLAVSLQVVNLNVHWPMTGAQFTDTLVSHSEVRLFYRPPVLQDIR